MKAKLHLEAQSKSKGQVVPIMALAMIGMLLIAALIIDGGNAWAQQRITQNGTDAAALAGATAMVQKLGGATKTDADVCSAVQTAAANQSVTVTSANYVDWNKAVVSAVCAGGAIPSSAAGVVVNGTRGIQTYISRLAGIANINTGAAATALAGTLNGICAADSGCGLIPVTFDRNVESCSISNAFIEIGSSTWPLVGIDTARADVGVGNYESILPLCKNGPGGFGWLDLSTVGCTGNLQQQIVTPCNHAFDIPTWVQTGPGNPNNVENAINDNYAGKVILIPLFDGTCRSVPASGLLPDCTNPGNGNNLYYHIPVFGAFLLDHAYIQGNNHPECNQAPGGPPVGGNGSTGCFKGWFVRYVTQGPVGSFDPNQDKASALGVQLVR